MKLRTRKWTPRVILLYDFPQMSLCRSVPSLFLVLPGNILLLQSWVKFDDTSVSGSLATASELRQVAAHAAIKGTTLDLPFGDKSLLSLEQL